MFSIRIPVAFAFIISLALAGYLGFSLIDLEHDKLIHFITFFILTVEFYFLFDTNLLKAVRYITFFVCTLGGSIFLEFLQNFINPTRIFDPIDICFNIGGSSMGLIICYIYQRSTRNRVKYRRLDRDYERAIPEEDTEEYVNINMQDVET